MIRPPDFAVDWVVIFIIHKSGFKHMKLKGYAVLEQ